MDICKNLERDLVLICGDNIVKPENWSRLLRTARQSLTFVTLRAREYVFILWDVNLSFMSNEMLERGGERRKR